MPFYQPFSPTAPASGRCCSISSNNAIRFTDAGHIDVSARLADGEVEVSVADTGVGITQEGQASIFDEFYQADVPVMNGRGGAGLGLAVCKQVVQLHGGRITVESEVGKGSTFRFTIPLPEMGRARSRLVYHVPAGWQPPLPDNPLGKSLVILAPDEASSRLVARSIDDYRSLILTNPAQLTEVVESEHPAGVVLVRDPLTGATLASPMQVWEMSGRPDLGVVECEIPVAALAKQHLGVAGYLVKPIQPEDVVSRLTDPAQPPDACLVVDDDPGFRSLMQRTLAATYPDCDCRTCSADEALQALREQQFAYLFLDLVMPGRDGLSLLREARRDHLLDATRVVIVTGAPYVEELARLLPVRLSFSKKAQPLSGHWLACIKALLDAAPPDYSLPAAIPASRAGPLAAQAS